MPSNRSTRLPRWLQRVAAQFPAEHAECLEDWLVDLANARGARIVNRSIDRQHQYIPPTEQLVTNEELVVGICQLQCLDRPQMLRLAAQLISRNAVQLSRLKLLAEQERIGPILAELAKQALRVEPTHPLWRKIQETFHDEQPLKEPLLHWTRLAEPVMQNGRCNAKHWRLVA